MNEALGAITVLTAEALDTTDTATATELSSNLAQIAPVKEEAELSNRRQQQQHHPRQHKTYIQHVLARGSSTNAAPCS